jgi:hypothetical protein
MQTLTSVSSVRFTSSNEVTGYFSCLVTKFVVQQKCHGISTIY